MYARVHAELKMLDVSARSLGEAESPETETDPEKRKKQQEDAKKHKRWEELGQPIKAKMREDILFSLLPEYQQAARIYLHGWPDEKNDDKTPVTPLEGMSKSAAKAIMALVRAKTFTYGEWGNSKLWEQLKEDDGLARKRLEALADG